LEYIKYNIAIAPLQNLPFMKIKQQKILVPIIWWWTETPPV